MVEGARLEYECAVHPAPRVRIPPSPQRENTCIFLWRGNSVHSNARYVGIRKAQAVYDFVKRSETKLSPSPGRKLLTSDSEFRDLTPNPSLSAKRKYLYFLVERE